MKRRVVATLLAVSMLALTFTGCGNGQPAEGTSTEETAEEAEGEASEEGGAEATGGMVSAEPVEMTFFRSINGVPYNEEMPTWQAIAEKTNVTLKGVISENNAAEKDAFNLMVGSGELADLICYKNMNEMEKLGFDGGLIPLNDLIEEHAPNIKAMLESDPAMKAAAYAYDGNIYQVPYRKSVQVAEYWWVRQDWLDTLELEAPETVDDLYDVLTAFRNEDPNGNGEKDEIPLFDRAGSRDPDEYLALWDTSLTFFVRDDKIEFEPLNDDFRLGVETMAKWYEEELIDPEFFTRGETARDALFGGNLSGITHDWQSASNYNLTLQESVPGFEMVPFAPMVNHNGDQQERTVTIPQPGTGISSTCADPVTAIKYLDFLCSEEGAIMQQWGVEGNTCEVVDGEYQYSEQAQNSELTLLGYLWSQGAQLVVTGIQAEGGEEASLFEDNAKEAFAMYSENTDWLLYDEELALKMMKYSPEEASEYQLLMSTIDSYVLETFQAWVLGTAELNDDTYQAFIDELKARDIDRAIEINQVAYDRYLETVSN